MKTSTTNHSKILITNATGGAAVTLADMRQVELNAKVLLALLLAQAACPCQASTSQSSSQQAHRTQAPSTHSPIILDINGVHRPN